MICSSNYLLIYKQVIGKTDIDQCLFEVPSKVPCNDSVVLSVRNLSSTSIYHQLYNSQDCGSVVHAALLHIHNVSLAKRCMLEVDVKNAFKSSRQQKMLRTIAQNEATRIHLVFICTTRSSLKLKGYLFWSTTVLCTVLTVFIHSQMLKSKRLSALSEQSDENNGVGVRTKRMLRQRSRGCEQGCQ